jgi:predicted transcriptional regulator|tara:strand:- start:3153 stop:3440 length:288 start_codon:yes stop_codon:yes gene_type:complete
MGTYRTHISIVGQILDSTTGEIDEDDGANITHLIRNANVSHGRLSKILNNLVSQGLLEQVNSERSCRYKISMSGREFLSAYKTFRNFSEDFGLTI